MKLNENIEILNEDNMLLMSKYPDKFFDLAFIDPEYGIGATKFISDRNGTQHGNAKAKCKEYTKKEWDNKCPDIAFFKEVFRVSKHQIIFGVNYYPYDLFAGGRIFWDKDNGENDYSDGEIAYCSLFNSVRKIKFKWHGMLQENMKNKENRIHPTQKPVGLYQRIILNWLKPNMKIITKRAMAAKTVAIKFFLFIIFYLVYIINYSISCYASQKMPVKETANYTGDFT